VTEIELEPMQTQRVQALHGHRDDLDFRFRLLEPDQLHPRLVQLAVRGDVRLVVAEHVRQVREAERLRLVAHARGDDPRDLRRDVRAQREDAARLAVDEREHVLLHALVGARGEDVEIFERRRHDLAITPALENPEQRASTCRLRAASSGR